MPKKNTHKFISLVVTAGLILSQFVLPLGQLSLLTGYSDTSETNLVTKKTVPKTETLDSDRNDVTITASSGQTVLATESVIARLNQRKTPTDLDQYYRAFAEMSQALAGENLRLVDIQAIETAYPGDSDQLETQLAFEQGLALNGLSDKTLRLGILTSDGQPITLIDTDKTNQTLVTADKKQLLSGLTYTAPKAHQLIIATTEPLEIATTLELSDYGSLTLDSTVAIKNVNHQPNPQHRDITVKVFLPKLGSIESTSDSADFTEVTSLSSLFTWQTKFGVIDYQSDDYDVVKVAYQRAHTSRILENQMLFGDYKVAPQTDDKGLSAQNVINIYLSSKQPLSFLPMLTQQAGILEPRGFRAALSRGNSAPPSFRRSLLPGPRALKPVLKAETSDTEVIEHHKRIDYLGDNGQQADNPDTSVDDAGQTGETSDLYRLYLDMTGRKEALDVLVVVDKSGSMQDPIGTDYRYQYQHYSLNRYNRWVNNGLVRFDSYQGRQYQPTNGDVYYYRGRVNVDTSGTRDAAVKTALLGGEGLLQKFLNINPKNKVAVVGFQGSVDYQQGNWQPTLNGGFNQPSVADSRDAQVLKPWGSTAELDSGKLTALNNNGTNYHAALLKASTMLTELKDDGRRKIMIFISDGVPTFYFGADQYRAGNGSSRDKNNIATVQEGTKTAIDVFKAQHPDVTTYALGVSKDINSNTASSSPVVLRYLSGEANYSGITNVDTLATTLNDIVESSKVSNITISDDLSQYVDYYAKQPDLLVTKISKTNPSDKEILYQDKEITDKGKAIIKSVGFETASSNASSGRVSLVFNPTYRVDDNYTYTVSFNVKASDKAYEAYRDGKGTYPDTGDKDTDYDGKTASSGKKGLPTNTNAGIHYTADGRPYDLTYGHPVLQITPISLPLLKVDAKNKEQTLDGVAFELRTDDKKTIWASGTTAMDGKLTFDYLQRGKTYYLYEKKAKEGYALPSAPWTIRLADDGKVTVLDQAGASLTLTGDRYVLNNQKINLPTTGGPGIFLYLLIGLMTASLSALAYYGTKRYGQI